MDENPAEGGSDRGVNALTAALDGAASGWSVKKTRALVHDTVVDVVLSSRWIGSSKPDKARRNAPGSKQVHARMVISIWKAEDERFFTLTFSSSASAPPTSAHRPISRTVSRVPKVSSASPSSHHSNSPGSSSHSNRSKCFHCGNVVSPSQATIGSNPFPSTAAPSILEKTLRMKDAMLNATDIPLFAMWKDGSLGFPNKAASNLMAKTFDATNEDAYDPLSRFDLYAEDFSRKLQPDQLPIVELCRTQTPIAGRRYGAVDSSGRRMIWEISGKGIHDESGVFIAGMISIKDVTRYTDAIKNESERNERQFRIICDAMPEMLWRASPDGYPGRLSNREYALTLANALQTGSLSDGTTTLVLPRKSLSGPHGPTASIRTTWLRRCSNGSIHWLLETNMSQNTAVNARMAHGAGCLAEARHYGIPKARKF